MAHPYFYPPDPAHLSICKGPSTAAPSWCYDLKDTVVICVQDGPKRKDYTLLRKLLIWHSSYFAAALDVNWTHESEQALGIQCEHSTFDAFCCWLYTNRLKDPVTNATCSNDLYLSPETLLNIWVFADFRGIPALGNAAIDMLHEQCFACYAFPSKEIKAIYKKTMAESNFRRFAIDFYKEAAPIEFILAYPDTYTPEFLCDVLPSVARRPDGEKLTRSQSERMDRCQWHDHSGPGGRLRWEGRGNATSMSASGA